jgi:hypothetical protein
MASNRNFVCVKAFSEIFPIGHLIHYIQAPHVKGEIKAVFCDLLLNLYIDKEPRMLIQKPNLVRSVPRSSSDKKHYKVPPDEEISIEFIKTNAKE